MELFALNPILAYQHSELMLHNWAHSTLHRAEPLWAILSEHFSPAQLIDVFVPLVGVLHHQLLVRLVSFMGVANAIASLVKWCLPSSRPYWFAREFDYLSNGTALPQHRLTCETSAGFPSSHTLSFTTFVAIIGLFYIGLYLRRCKVNSRIVVDRMNLPICLFISTFMCLSRLYLGTQFIYQCLLSAFSASALIYVFMVHATFLGTLSRRVLVITVLCLGLVPVFVYFAMLGMNIDPHWSVRMLNRSNPLDVPELAKVVNTWLIMSPTLITFMFIMYYRKNKNFFRNILVEIKPLVKAFKWCADPSFLRHEASPVFVLARDFGYLMGVALSAPVYKRYEKKTTSFTKRLLCLLFVGMLNYYARLGTPKQHGRFVFVAYEFTRNLIHSYTLLSILSKLT